MDVLNAEVRIYVMKPNETYKTWRKVHDKIWGEVRNKVAAYPFFQSWDLIKNQVADKVWMDVFDNVSTQVLNNIGIDLANTIRDNLDQKNEEPKL
jgi:hypothetical protein